MLGLPQKTEIHQPIAKTAIHEKFHLTPAARKKMDADISRMVITNEISPATVRIAGGERVKAFFVVHVLLKKKDFNAQTIAGIFQLIPQKMLFVLACGEEEKLAIHHTKLMQTGWQAKGRLGVDLKGSTLDAVWENMVVQIGGVRMEGGNTLDAQIEADDRRQRLENEITRLDKLAWKEKQPKKKFELAGRVNKLKKALEEMKHGKT